MELRGIEPLSENPSIEASPITVIALCVSSTLFPPRNAQGQAFRFSSFIILPLPQSFGSEVPHQVDAGFLSGEQPKPDTPQLGSER